MGAALTQMNTRISIDEKRRGDAVLEKYGLTPSHAVRALWRHLAETKKLPAFMVESAEQDASAAERAEAGAGMAMRLARQAGLHCEPLAGMSYEQLREGAFEEWLFERQGDQQDDQQGDQQGKASR